MDPFFVVAQVLEPAELLEANVAGDQIRFHLHVFGNPGGEKLGAFRRENLKWAFPCFFFIYFRLFQTNITIFTTNVKKCRSSKLD